MGRGPWCVESGGGSPAWSVRMRGLWAGGVVAWLALVTSVSLEGQSLGGSAASLDRQNAQARAHDFSYLATARRIATFVEAGYLVPVAPDRNFELNEVSFPYARPEVRLFVQRLAAQYRAACGEKLVVTSLTRPLSSQPWNASDRSVHPTGMAVDLRRSGRSSCRTWLESTLVSLEASRVLEATRERNPPHYHVAVYPAPYASYVARIIGGQPLPARFAEAVSEASGAVDRPEPVTVGSPTVRHTVVRGDALSTIARDYGVDVRSVRRANGITGDRILVGQTLAIPLPEGRGIGSPIRHTVMRGESLWTIARAYGVTENAIRGANGIGGSRLLVGDVLTIPGGDLGAAIVRYTVERGDSLWIIASRHGTTVERIRHSNGLRTSRIYEGQVLSVPLTF